MAKTANILNLRRDSIIPDHDQPRKTFSEEKLWELAGSLRENGLLQPITVRPTADRQYTIIAGERRWRAAGLLGWDTIPAIVRANITDGEAAKLQLLENIVRQDLDPVEEARALKRFLDEGYDVGEISRSTGIAPSQITWRVQMLNAREDVLQMVARGHVKPSVAFEVSKLSPNGQARALRALNRERLTTTEVELLCQRIWAEEHQSQMFADEPRLTEEHQRAARTFGEVFDGLGRVLTRLEEMEQRKPGLMAEALANEGEVVELKVDQMVKALYRVKKALQTRRMHLVAETA